MHSEKNKTDANPRRQSVAQATFKTQGLDGRPKVESCGTQGLDGRPGVESCGTQGLDGRPEVESYGTQVTVT